VSGCRFIIILLTVIRQFHRPLLLPVSENRWKYAGTVITASVTSLSEIIFSCLLHFLKIIAEISWENTCVINFYPGVLLSPLNCIRNPFNLFCNFIIGSPINLLIEKTVFFALVIACRFAGSPTLRSPFSTKATIEGVVSSPRCWELLQVHYLPLLPRKNLLFQIDSNYFSHFIIILKISFLFSDPPVYLSLFYASF